MNDYAPASSLGWLDFDDAARDKVAETLRALDEPSTLDVLGLGTIRDAFADMLSPGTSTVQTRLRYFLFVAWILKRLEDEGVPAADFDHRRRHDEAKLMDRLRHLGQRQGVIGYWAGRKLRRMPSDIYWRGLVAWGIRKPDVSIAEYGRAAARGPGRAELDDDGNATAQAESMWVGLPPTPDDFLKAPIGFEVQPEEAEFLVDRIRQSQPDSLLAVLSGDMGSRQEPVGPVVGAPTNHPDEPAVAVQPQAVGPAAGGPAGLSLDQFDYPWQVPMEFRGRLGEVLHHARCFSELSLGSQLVYSLLLAQRARENLGRDTEELEELEEKEWNRLKEWATMVERRSGELSAWVDAPMEFRGVLAAYNISPVTLNFWAGMARRAVDQPSKFAQDSEVRRLVIERERSLKRQRARLSHTAALENWGGRSAASQLDYRWYITKQYLGELAAARVGV